MDEKYSRDIIYSRMIGLVSQEELDLLAVKTIAVPGCGGVGYTHAETLVRMGVGGVKIADFDTFGPENFNRQFELQRPHGRPEKGGRAFRKASVNKPGVAHRAV